MLASNAITCSPACAVAYFRQFRLMVSTMKIKAKISSAAIYAFSLVNRAEKVEAAKLIGLK